MLFPLKPTWFVDVPDGHAELWPIFLPSIAPLAHPSQLPREWPAGSQGVMLSTGLSMVFQVWILAKSCHTNWKKIAWRPSLTTSMHGTREKRTDRAADLDFFRRGWRKGLSLRITFSNSNRVTTLAPKIAVTLMLQTRKCDDSPVETIGISSQKGPKQSLCPYPGAHFLGTSAMVLAGGSRKLSTAAKRMTPAPESPKSR